MLNKLNKLSNSYIIWRLPPWIGYQTQTREKKLNFVWYSIILLFVSSTQRTSPLNHKSHGNSTASQWNTAKLQKLILALSLAILSSSTCSVERDCVVHLNVRYIDTSHLTCYQISALWIKTELKLKGVLN